MSLGAWSRSKPSLASPAAGGRSRRLAWCDHYTVSAKPRKANAQLAPRAKELAVAQEKAEEASQAKSDFSPI